MEWRFRKSFCPPGVRLNFSPRGISASVGAGPVRFYAGSQGAPVTTRIPGKGIGYRQSLKLPHSLAATPQAIPNGRQPEFGIPQAEEPQ